ncbi:MAG TPA: DUF1631 domain-containing protein [Gammaproteobacteria bacterium]|nr:DUF1631 domain-containing protein [Gammaproteobacteria bacterium]
MLQKKNIVEMHQYARKLSPRACDIMQQTELLAISSTDMAIKSMMDKADDTLFDLANKADSNVKQQLYFDAMRDIRLRRKHIEQKFIELYKKQFELFAAGKPLGIDLQEIIPDQEIALELIDDSNMEEDIALANMAARSARENYQALYELTIRLSALSGRENLDATSHPLSPNSVAHAIGACLEHMDIEFQVKLIVYKLFDKYVFATMASVYKDINSLLTEHGIVPVIKHKVKINPNAADYRGHPGPAQAQGDPVTEQNMGGVQHGAQPGMGLPGGPIPSVGTQYGGYVNYAGNNFVATEGSNLLGALTAMQGYVLNDSPAALDSPAMIGGQALNLSSQIANLHGRPGGHSSDDASINMVSLIFEYILEDRNIPDQIKSLLARLQIPFLKVSLLDKTFFGQNKHPARKLLNNIAQFSCNWNFDDDSSQDALVLKVRSIVEHILDQFSDNLGLFEEMLDEFESFIQQEEARNYIFEERARRTQEGKDRVEMARTRVNVWLQTWVSRKDMPEFINDFLRVTWRNILQVTMLKYGEDSDEWQTHVKTINTLIWSISPDKTAEDGQRLVEVLPSLIKFLRSGMEAASVHPGVEKIFFEQLAQFHVQAVNGGQPRELRDSGISTSARPDKQAVAQESVSPQEPALQALQEELISEYEKGAEPSEVMTDASDLQQLEAVAEEIIIEAPLSQVTTNLYDYEDEYTEIADQLIVGDWVEFYDSEGKNTRAKLSWQSEMSGTCLFVTRKGTRFAEKSLTGLAAELRCGRAQVMDTVPVMDKAISALLGRTRK